MNRRFLLTVVLSALVVLLGACGGTSTLVPGPTATAAQVVAKITAEAVSTPTPDAGVEVVAQAAFEAWAAANGEPYRDVQVTMAANDGYLAKVRLIVWFRPTAGAAWEEREAAADCKRVGDAWQCGEQFAFAVTEGEIQRRAEGTGKALGLDPTSVRVGPVDGATYVRVPAGEFLMGSSEEQFAAAMKLCEEDFGAGNCDRRLFESELPQHAVALDEYWIGRTEVTNAQYVACVEGGGCTEPHERSSNTRDSYYGRSDYANYPVINVDWSQAEAFCTWAGGRLPTEAEWEKAARGTDGRIYPWGDSAPDKTLANFNGNEGDTTVVGSYPSGASPYGALDMAGNVWEWVSDWYQADTYVASPTKNPTGPATGDRRVLRGGSWLYNVGSVRAAYRYYNFPGWAVNGGFRCVGSR